MRPAFDRIVASADLGAARDGQTDARASVQPCLMRSRSAQLACGCGSAACEIPEIA